MSNPYDLGTVLADIVRFRDQRDWQQYHYPKDLAAGISIEAAELQELFLWKGQERPNVILSDKDRMENITDEIADVAIYLLLLTNELDIDLRAAIARKLKKNALKYPVEGT